MNTRPYRIWAPRARELAIVVVRGEAREAHPAKPEAGGYFSAKLPEGVDYFLRVDGRDMPDPRSRFQPWGVSGPSRNVTARFAWNDAHFRARPLSAALIYELHVGTFTEQGTLTAAVERLPHLVELGVTHVELMPLAAYPGRWGWGYDGVALFAPHAAYGTPEDLKRFVATCHALGLAVLIDVVYNHFGPDGCYLGEYGHYFTSRYRTPWGDALNFDGADSDEVRRFFVDNACMWLEEYHFDGLRVDAVHALFDESALHILEELTARVHELEASLGRPLVVIAESDQNDPRVTRPAALGGYGVDAQWSDDFHHAVHSVLTGETNGYYADFGRIEHIARALTNGFVYVGEHSISRKRKHGRPLGDTSGHKLLAYLQTHDQVGNRARGERLGHLVPEGLARIGAALLFVSPFVPMLFQGEEWGSSAPFQYFTDHQDPELAEAVRRGRREEFRAFGWDPEQVPDPQAESTFRRSKLRWEERDHSPYRERLNFYRALIRLRRDTPDLLGGRRERVEVSFDEDERWLRVTRGSICLVVNFAEQPRALPTPPGVLVLSSTDEPPRTAGSSLTAAAQSCYMFRC